MISLYSDEIKIKYKYFNNLASGLMEVLHETFPKLK